MGLVVPQHDVLSDIDLSVKKFLSDVFLPEIIDCSVIKYYVRKAVRLGVWRLLKPESKALMKASTQWRGIIKSRVLKEILKEIFLQIELNTVRGKALLYGIIITLKNNLRELLTSTKKLICLGISYLSNPPLYRHYG